MREEHNKKKMSDKEDKNNNIFFSPKKHTKNSKDNKHAMGSSRDDPKHTTYSQKPATRSSAKIVVGDSK